VADVPARPLTGEPLPLDLLNTEWVEPDGPVDALESDPGVVAFLGEHGVTVSAAELTAAARALRSARDTIRTMVERGAATPDDLAAVRSQIRHARIELEPDGAGGLRRVVVGDRAAWTVPVRAVLDAVTLLEEQPGRVRRCAHPDCVLWFLDTSKRGDRRWHSMETCGNRAKAKRHYERHRDQPGRGTAPRL
jgi:predicted RNA-binding Zn ribbon-like protein